MILHENKDEPRGWFILVCPHQHLGKARTPVTRSAQQRLSLDSVHEWVQCEQDSSIPPLSPGQGVS